MDLQGNLVILWPEDISDQEPVKVQEFESMLGGKPVNIPTNFSFGYSTLKVPIFHPSNAQNVQNL